MNKTAFALNLLERGSIVGSESCEKGEYSILSTGLPSPALHRLHSAISYFIPPSGIESGEAGRRLLASRGIGGFAMTSDDPAPGSLIVFQSSRDARPQDASKALYLVSVLSSLARVTLRPVSEVAGQSSR